MVQVTQAEAALVVEKLLHLMHLQSQIDGLQTKADTMLRELLAELESHGHWMAVSLVPER